MTHLRQDMAVNWADNMSKKAMNNKIVGVFRTSPLLSESAMIPGPSMTASPPAWTQLSTSKIWQQDRLTDDVEYIFGHSVNALKEGRETLREAINQARIEFGEAHSEDD